MKKLIIATYIGGPLDGQTAIRTGNRWSSYRDENGIVISTKKGDRWGGPKRYRGAKIYIAKQYHTLEAGELVLRVDYVHATKWADYQDDRRSKWST